MSNDGVTTWPDKFVYMCNVGSGMNVNLAPMLHAGAARVTGLVILQSLTSPNDPSKADHTHSIEPTKRLRAYATEVLGLPHDKILVIKGHADLLTDWTDALNKACSFAADLGEQDLVYNITSGRKPCTLGALLGMRADLAAAADISISLISVGLSPFSVRHVDLQGGGLMNEHVLPVENRLSLADYLKSYGFAERNPEARRQSEQLLLRHGEDGRKILSWIDGQDRKNAQRLIGSLHFAIAGEDERRKRKRGKQGRDDFHPCIIRPQGERADNLRKCLHWLKDHRIIDNLPGTTLVTEGSAITGLEIADTFSLEFLGGKWLEAAIFSCLWDKVGSRRDVELAVGVILPAGDKADTGEVDILALCNDRLMLVEIKAVTSVRNLHGEIAKLGSRRNRFAGQQGTAWLLAPALDRWQLNRAGLLDVAEQEGVQLEYGRYAISNFIKAAAKELR